MANFVFLTSRFFPKADASGICVYNVAQELIKQGHQVACIVEGEKNETYIYDNIKIYAVRQTRMGLLIQKATETRKKKDIILVKIYGFLRKCWQGAFFFRFPNVSPSRAQKEYKILKRMHAEFPIDCIVACFRPFDGMVAMLHFSQKVPEVKTVACFWDFLQAKNPFGKKLHPLFSKLCYRAEKKIFSSSNRILLPKSGKEMYLSNKFDFTKEKIRFFDFPVFLDTEQNAVQRKNQLARKQVYCIGSIDGKNRSSAYFLKLIENLIETLKVDVHFVGTFVEMEIYNLYKEVPWIFFHGNISPDDAMSLMEQADFLVNFGNKETYGMIPSKIFQYFSTCNPIINIVANEKDAALPYFKKYAATCNLFEYEADIERDCEKLRNFMLEENRILPSHEEVGETFRESKPSFFAQYLTEII